MNNMIKIDLCDPECEDCEIIELDLEADLLCKFEEIARQRGQSLEDVITESFMKVIKNLEEEIYE